MLSGLVVRLLASKIFKIIVIALLEAMAKSTKTDVDDAIVAAVKKALK